jgi:ATP-binding cassette subfamily C (CFTR/MRP) protein 2
MCQDLSKLPTALILSFIILYYYFGFCFLISLLPIPITLIVNVALAKRRRLMQEQMEIASDSKSNKINETLTNAKMIKLYGWQQKFKNFITKARDHEK